MRNGFVLLVVITLLLLLLPKPVNSVQCQNSIDYGTMPEAEQDIFDSILFAMANEQAVVQCDDTVNHDRIKTHLGMYYGTLKGVGRLYTVVNGNIHLNLKVFIEYEQNRLVVSETVDEVLSHIKEGSDRSMLRQIARYIADNYSYSNDFVCADYAILFYKIASRLGIESYLCFGYAGKELHVWNYAGGRYWDVTHFDSTGQRKWLGSKTAWERLYVCNDAWSITN